MFIYFVQYLFRLLIKCFSFAKIGDRTLKTDTKMAI